MTIYYQASDRKPLVKAISEITGEKAQYQYTPSYAFKIGAYTVTREGNLEFEDGTDAKVLIEALAQHGFTAEAATKTQEVPTEEPSQLGWTVSLPLEKAAVGNLTNLLEAKGHLIRKALNVTDIRIEVENGWISFPWFDEVPEADAMDAYTRFICALCEMSLNQKRINATEKAVDNEKYAFRCFLLRLGFIGNEFKAVRKILLRNLSGSAAFKSGAKKEATDDAISQ